MPEDEAVMIEWAQTLGLVLEPAVGFNDVRAKLDRLERRMAELDYLGFSNARNYGLVMAAALRGAGVPSS